MDGFGAEDIGRRVRAYRRAAGLTADQLAEKVDGLTGNAVAKLENGHRSSVSTELLVELAWALNIPPIVLLMPIEDERAKVTLAGHPHTMEELGGWVQGLPVAATGQSKATFLAHAVNAQYRQLTINAMHLNDDVTTQLIERGTLSPAEATDLHRRTDEALEVNRVGMRVLRSQLGIEDPIESDLLRFGGLRPVKDDG